MPDTDSNGNGAAPTILHVTHYKAGSSWIDTVLRRCAKDRIVLPQGDLKQFFDQPVQEGKIYPKLYVTRERFEQVELPERWRRFIVIRDLRDTMISNYFSLKTSHPDKHLSPEVLDFRRRLNERNIAEGLMLTLDEWVPSGAADIQTSWLESGEEILRFEKLVGNEEEMERVLIDQCELPVPRARLRSVIREASFENLSGGRKPGQEDLGSHWRKGIAGDWKNYFSKPLKDAFKARYGELLIATGYEQDLKW